MRKRAINNWRKLKVLLVLLSLSGGKMEFVKENDLDQHLEEENAVVRSWREKLAPYIISPMSPYKVIWDLIIGLNYLVAYTIDPYILAFKEMDH